MKASIGNKIREMRLEKGLSQEELMKDEMSSGDSGSNLQKSSAMPVGSETENHRTNEKVIAQLEARLQEKDEIITMLQQKKN